MPRATPYRTAPSETLARRLVPAPHQARRVAKATALSFVALALIVALSPWQQNVTGSGRVFAFSPEDREQTIESPIDGRVRVMHVREGMHVEAGELLMELSDVDPERLERLERQRVLAEEQVASYQQRLETLHSQLESIRSAEESAVRAAQARARVADRRVEAARQSLSAAEADLDTALLNLTRQRVLGEQGLVSQRELELARLDEARARTARDSARAQHSAAQSEAEAALASLEQARADRDAAVSSATASIRSAETQLAASRTDVLSLHSSVARQGSQRIVAPREGTISRMIVRQGSEQVRAGDPLMVLVPKTDDRAVEIIVDGNDAALIGPGRHVRLQFEGWPAVQFVGWPSVAVGTFGGKVAFVDPSDNGNGDFRVVVLPDDADEAWPDSHYLRQGVRANGWVLLEQVSLGFEIWRQINGFPPSLSAPATRHDEGN